MTALMPPVTADMMLADYLAEVRANGDWAIRNVANARDENHHEIVYEVLEAAERARPKAMAHYSNNGELSDQAWDMADWAAEAAIDICKMDAAHAGFTNTEED